MRPFLNLLKASLSREIKGKAHNFDLISDRFSSDIFRAFNKHPCSKQLHNYLPIYDLYLSPIRHSVKRVLEIGVEAGDSLKMWEDYFPNAEIHGFDLNPNCKQFEGGRRFIHIGDQEKISDYDTLPDDFDVVIDDGSHQTKHQIISFKHVLANRMRERGIYFVEDVTNRPKTVDFFVQFAHSVNYWPDELDEGDWPKLNDLSHYVSDPYHLNVIGVSFYRFLIAVQKGRNPADGHAHFRENRSKYINDIVRSRREFFDGQVIKPRNL